jgi:hypothetical protein
LRSNSNTLFVSRFSWQQEKWQKRTAGENIRYHLQFDVVLFEMTLRFSPDPGLVGDVVIYHLISSGVYFIGHLD